MNYYKHMEGSEGGRTAAIKNAAEHWISELKRVKEEIDLEIRYHEGVLNLVGDSVCGHCGGSGRVTYYPAGTSPGQGARTSIPCPQCHPVESKEKSDKLDKSYRGY